jgi:mannose-6-phosphate isomerase-like protein (cupin superfamily)
VPMNTSVVLLLSLGMQAASAAPPPAAPAPQVPAQFITAAEAEAVLKEQIAKKVVDQPMKSSQVVGGLASVAWLHRAKAEAGALIHNKATETYYIVKGSGTLVTGGELGGAKPIDLTRVNAGMGMQGTRQGGEGRRVNPGDIIMIPAGTVHSFSELDGPISYLVFRFEAK